MKSILFVDDDPSVLSGIRRGLYELQDEWDMTFVESAAEALELLVRQTTDIVVTDIDMPGMTGLELLLQITCGQFGFIPVVVLTGNSERHLKRHALDLGAADFINKPVEVEDLVLRIRSVLTIKKLHDELSSRNASLESTVAERTRELENSRIELVIRLAKAAELRDENTGNHVVRVALFSKLLAESYGLAPPQCREIMLASTLHDIGKISIPDSILLKPGPLDPQERKVMESHAETGHRMLSEPEPFLQSIFGEKVDEVSDVGMLQQTAALIAFTHHEKWDGSGYPRRLRGKSIPIEGRIVSVADVYDALRSDRPYKAAFSQEESFDILRKNAGSHHDPAMVEAFLCTSDKIDEIEHKLGREQRKEVLEQFAA